MPDPTTQSLDLVFRSVAYKTLVQVDLPNKGSHQHELNGSRALGKLLGFERLKGSISWKRFSESDTFESEEGEFTWYDAREKSSSRTGRSEWRFYYTGSFLSRAEVGDVLVFAKTNTGQVLGLVFGKDSHWMSVASDLFGADPASDTIQVIDHEQLATHNWTEDNPILKALGFTSKEDPDPTPILDTRDQLDTGEFKFRPASRLIATIGQDLIKDPPAALIELVKNAYDADASHVTIDLERSSNVEASRSIKFRISDDGHGMSRETVVSTWLVPATAYKSMNKYSPNGRRMQGNKGIGRYAAFVLGSELLLRTTDPKNQETTVFLDWDDFQKHEFLDQVPVLVETKPTHSRAGTIFEITAVGKYASAWHEGPLGLLRSELRKLISPFRDESDPFAITLNVSGFPEPYVNLTEEIEPLSLVQFFDYRLSGTITEEGIATLLFENQVGRGDEPRDVEIRVLIPGNEGCGRVEIDLRVYDRDPAAIGELISRGLHDPETGKELGKREARALLNSNSGISIFRGDFKIRPYGDPGFDWLELDKQRVQNPSLRIGSNQVIGFVRIQPEEVSHLEEKSARDGLKEDSHFNTLKQVVKAALSELEQRRFIFRKKIGRGRRTVKVDEVVSQLTDFESTISKIEEVLAGSSVGQNRIEAIRNVLEETRREKEELIGQIQETIAIYQGQATLGKIIMVLLHEGRKPIGYFRDMAPLLRDWIDRLRTAPDDNLLSKLLTRLENVQLQADVLTKLFDRLEPLSVKKRHKPHKFSLIRTIKKSLDVFQSELNRISVTTEVDPRLDTMFLGWEEDFLLIFTNLIENSVYWFDQDQTSEPEISIQMLSTPFGSTIQYTENGPGIPEEFIRDQSVFEPGFSTKIGGTGLGLAIAGEAAERNGCKLKAYHSEVGAKFVLELFPGLDIK
jgi:signal transduction histidine kinase